MRHSGAIAAPGNKTQLKHNVNYRLNHIPQPTFVVFTQQSQAVAVLTTKELLGIIGRQGDRIA